MTFVYILRCIDDTLYTGYTTNLKDRIIKHNDKIGAKYTKGKTPVELVYFEIFDTKSEALKREIAIKKMSKNKKERIIYNFDKEKLLDYWG